MRLRLLQAETEPEESRDKFYKRPIGQRRSTRHILVRADLFLFVFCEAVCSPHRRTPSISRHGFLPVFQVSANLFWAVFRPLSHTAPFPFYPLLKHLRPPVFQLLLFFATHGGAHFTAEARLLPPFSLLRLPLFSLPFDFTSLRFPLAVAARLSVVTRYIIKVTQPRRQQRGAKGRHRRA